MSLNVPRRYWFAVSLLLGIAFTIVFGLAVRSWANPWEPLVAFVMFGMGPMIFWGFLGAFALDPTRTEDALVNDQSPSLRERFRLTFMPILVVGVVYAALTLLWAWPAARVGVVKMIGTMHMAPTIALALDDRVPSVRLAACESLGDEGSDTAALALSQRLQDPDEQVVDCAVGAMTGRDRDAVMVQFVADQWTAELLSEADLDGDRACQLSNRVRATERLGYQVSSVRLMQCALSAPSSAARECCSQAFRSILGPAQASPSMLFPPPAELVQRGFIATVPDLITTTYSDDPKHAYTRQQLRLDSERERAWVLNTACESLAHGGARWRGEISSLMADSIASETCTVTPATETTVRLWTAACSAVFTAEPGSLSMSEDAALCIAIDQATVHDAMSETQHRTAQALRRAQAPGESLRIFRELLDYQSSVPKMKESGRGGMFMPGGGNPSRMSFFSGMISMAGSADSQVRDDARESGDEEKLDQAGIDPTSEMAKMMKTALKIRDRADTARAAGGDVLERDDEQRRQEAAAPGFPFALPQAAEPQAGD